MALKSKQAEGQYLGAFHFENEKLYLGRTYLIKEVGFSLHAVNKWFDRNKNNANDVIRRCGKPYLLYEAIPKESRASLPSKAKLTESYKKQIGEALALPHLQALELNMNSSYHVYNERIRQEFPDLDHEKRKLAALKMHFWEYVSKLPKGDNEALLSTYNLLIGVCYSDAKSFAQSRYKCNKIGVYNMGIDGRKDNTNRNPVHPFIRAAILKYLDTGQNFSAQYIHDDLLRQNLPYEIPCVKTIRKIISELLLNEVTRAKAYGIDKATANGSFATLIQAKNIHTQWQIDGWTMPFYTKVKLDSGKHSFKSLTIVCVLDAHSRKVIGFEISMTENTISILAAIRDAVTTTERMPNEIIMDNHSFQNTKEAENFKAEANKIGTILNVSMNPKRKSVEERFFRTFGSKFCRQFKGYCGEGIKSKGINARPSQEVIDDNFKNWLTPDDIKTIGAECVNLYNETHNFKGEKTPNERYNASEPRGFEVDVFKRASLLMAKSEATVTRGQISIIRGGVKYEYIDKTGALNDWEGQRVAICYEDLRNEIYVFEIKTGYAIAKVEPKPIIHAATADQTEADSMALYSLRDDKRENKQRAIQQRGNVYEALEEDPEIAYLLNPLKNPKDRLHELRDFAATPTHTNIKSKASNEATEDITVAPKKKQGLFSSNYEGPLVDAPDFE